MESWTELSVEESIRMTEDRDKWRKYVHGVANPRIEDGTEQNVTVILCTLSTPLSQESTPTHHSTAEKNWLARVNTEHRRRRVGYGVSVQSTSPFDAPSRHFFIRANQHGSDLHLSRDSNSIPGPAGSKPSLVYYWAVSHSLRAVRDAACCYK